MLEEGGWRRRGVAGRGGGGGEREKDEKYGRGLVVMFSAEVDIAQRDVRDMLEQEIKLVDLSICWRREGWGVDWRDGRGVERKTRNTPGTWPSCLLLTKISLRGTFVISWSWTSSWPMWVFVKREKGEGR